MDITVSYVSGKESGKETIKDADRYEKRPDTVIEKGTTYYSYDDCSVIKVSGEDLTALIENKLGESERHENVIEIVKNPESMRVKKQNEEVYLETNQTIVWVAT